VTLAVISMELWVFRWVVNRMNVFSEYREEKEELPKKAEVLKWKTTAM
jgi:hypothetical protein